MKNFLNAVWDILEEIGRTRAAAAAAQAGEFDISRELMRLSELPNK